MARASILDIDIDMAIAQPISKIVILDIQIDLFVCTLFKSLGWVWESERGKKYNSAYVSACLRVSESFIWCVRHFFARIKRNHCHIILIANFMEMIVEGWQITKICLLHISHLKGTPTLDCARCSNEWIYEWMANTRFIMVCGPWLRCDSGNSVLDHNFVHFFSS